MNKVIISGNLTRDMDVKVLANETLVGNFTVANQVGYGEKAKTNFVPVTMFGKRVESMEKYLVTGANVLIEGEIDYKSVQYDKGNWKNYFSVIVHNIEIIKFKEDNPFEDDNKNKRNNRKGGRR